MQQPTPQTNGWQLLRQPTPLQRQPPPPVMVENYAADPEPDSRQSCTGLQEEKAQALVSIPRLLLRQSLGRGIKANKPVRAFLSYYSGQSSAANTLLQTGFLIAPNQDASWSSWQATFDEFKVINAEIMWNVYYTTVPSVYPANSPNACIVYDPTSSVTLASVNAALQFERFSLLRCMLPAANGPLASPMCFEPSGYCRFRTKIPQGSTVSLTQTVNSTGLWRPTADASSYDWGQFAAAVSAGGTSAVMRIEGFVRMEVEFRVRR